MHFWTDEPQKELWRQLRYLASPSNVCSILTGKIESNRSLVQPDSDDTRVRAYQIAACVRQADEYQIASESVGLATRPLLDFYSCQALAKAVCLATRTEVNLEQLNYHGLSINPSTVRVEAERTALQQYRNDSSEWSVEREFAVTNEGVFMHLCRALGDMAPEKGLVANFREIVRSTPDMSAMYERHYGESSACFYLYGNPKTEGKLRYEVYFSNKTDMDSVKKVFPEFLDGYEEAMQHQTAPGFVAIDEAEGAPEWINLQSGAIAGTYLVRQLSCGVRTSGAALFLGLFILSNIVRYRPAFWMKEIEGEESGAASIVDGFCSLARRKLPQDLLECFWQEKFKFASPGYIS